MFPERISQIPQKLQRIFFSRELHSQNAASELLQTVELTSWHTSAVTCMAIQALSWISQRSTTIMMIYVPVLYYSDLVNLQLQERDFRFATRRYSVV
jgi:hypothetical protein